MQNEVRILLKGLNCAHCAGKIEEAVNKQDNVAEARLNFVTKVITVTVNDNSERKAVLRQVRDIVNSIESGVDVVFADKKKSRRHSQGVVEGGISGEEHTLSQSHIDEEGCGCKHHGEHGEEHHHGEGCGCKRHGEHGEEHHHGEGCGCHHHNEECEHHHKECEYHHKEQQNIITNIAFNKEDTVKILLKGLNCAHCAGKIEETVNKQENIAEARLNFVTKELLVTPADKEDKEQILKQVRDIVNSIESGVEVSLIEKRNTKESDEQYEFEENEENEEKSKLSKTLLRFGGGIVVYIAAIVFPQPVNILLFAAAYIIFGYDVVIRAFKNISRGQVFDENFLMMIASMGAFVISLLTDQNEYTEAVAVMLFYQVGEALQDRAVDKSRRSIRGLMDLKAEKANVIIDGAVREIDPEDIEKGDICVVRAGEKIPVDGVVTEGSTSLDMSALTGEAEEVLVSSGDSVISGSINKNAVIQIRAEREYSNSTVARIMDMVENAVTNKSSTESFITKFAKVYTPIVVGIAVLLALIPPLFDGLVLNTGFDFVNWVERALVFLVSSCPCALVISIPLTFFSGLGVSSKNGVLIKGSNYLQALAEVNTVVFDKTGTITKGKFEVTEVKGDKDTLKYAASLEVYSNHPVARAITKHYAGSGEYFHPENTQEIKGMGMTAKINGKNIAVGNSRLMEELNIEYDKQSDASIFVAADYRVIGSVNVEDAVKPDSIKAISMFKRLGINNIIMLTGDKKQNAEKTAKLVGIRRYYAELLPQNKVEKLEEIYAQNPDTKAVFVGDGINDAPVLARADVGAAMGEIGSDAAIEAADMVIMHDEISKLAKAIKIAVKTVKTARENVVFVLAVKMLVLVLAVFGYASMWLAVFADVGVALLAIANSIKILRVK